MPSDASAVFRSYYASERTAGEAGSGTRRRKPSPVHVRSVLPLVGQTPYKGFHILDRGHCLLIRTVSRVTQDRGQIAVLNVTERHATRLSEENQ